MRSDTKILLIEDNAADAKMVKMMLSSSRLRHVITHTETLYEGNNSAADKTPDLVLLDLTLPDSNGFKTLTTFLDKNPSIPVVVMTGLNDETVGNQAVKAGAQDYLIKGQFDDKLLARVIRYSLQRAKIQFKLEETARNLSVSERRYQEAQEMASFGNFELNLVSNEMTWSDEVFRIVGYTPNSISPTMSDYLNICHFEERNEVEEFFQNASKDGVQHTMEHRIIIDGRKIHHVQINCKVYYDEVADKLALVGGIQDITERKLNEQLLLEKNIQTKASKIKEDVLQDMSFHIRTPLSSILNISYILSHSQLNDIEGDLLQGLKSSVNDLSISVNNMLNFSMLLSEKVNLEIEETHLIDFIQSLKQLVQLKATQKNIQLKFNSAPNIPEHFKTDSNKLNQILYNLIDNAIKFNHEGGTVQVDFSKENLEDEQFTLVVEVTDSGIGISRTRQKEILQADDLLIQNYEEGEKAQLGLAIVSKLTKSLGGAVSLVSEKGEGATFTIRIPVTFQQKVKIKLNEPVTPLKILLVEDHFLNQLATKRVLTSWTDLVTVDIAENGLVGLDKFKEYDYDVVLMDLQMPVMDGFESTRKIREISDKPIIALTANSSKQEAEKCLEIGMNQYLPKPFKPEDLYAVIMEVLSPVNE